MAQQKRRKFDFIVAIKYLFIFIFVVAHFQMLRGTAEVIPVLIPTLSEQTDGIITEHYTKTRSSSNTISRYSNHSSISYYLETSFKVDETDYSNTDLVDEITYDQVDIGDQVKINFLNGIPQVAILEINKSHGIKNHVLLSSILIGVDLLIWLIWRWFKKRKNQRKK